MSVWATWLAMSLLKWIKWAGSRSILAIFGAIGMLLPALVQVRIRVRIRVTLILFPAALALLADALSVRLRVSSLTRDLFAS
jgi:hypothetical protein